MRYYFYSSFHWSGFS